MPKVVGVRERRHQPYWDTLIRTETSTAPTPPLQSENRLFNGTNLGLAYWTNMTVAGQLPSDNTYIILAMRCYLYFTGTAALIMYQYTSMQLYLTLVIGDKPQFQAPAWFFPQGGGIFGVDSATPAMTNGVPQTDAILKLAKPIPLPARQNFYVTANFHDVGTVSVRTLYLNSVSSASIREVKVFIDGIHTRDVL